MNSKRINLVVKGALDASALQKLMHDLDAQLAPGVQALVLVDLRDVGDVNESIEPEVVKVVAKLAQKTARSAWLCNRPAVRRIVWRALDGARADASKAVASLPEAERWLSDEETRTRASVREIESITGGIAAVVARIRDRK